MILPLIQAVSSQAALALWPLKQVVQKPPKLAGAILALHDGEANLGKHVCISGLYRPVVEQEFGSHVASVLRFLQQGHIALRYIRSERQSLDRSIEALQLS
jgi:hypothetical protein